MVLQLENDSASTRLVSTQSQPQLDFVSTRLNDTHLDWLRLSLDSSSAAKSALQPPKEMSAAGCCSMRLISEHSSDCVLKMAA